MYFACLLQKSKSKVGSTQKTIVNQKPELTLFLHFYFEIIAQ